jgi:serine/threonine protein kinase HipA of HipAB toxin-antitoxin module
MADLEQPCAAVVVVDAQFRQVAAAGLPAFDRRAVVVVQRDDGPDIQSKVDADLVRAGRGSWWQTTS